FQVSLNYVKAQIDTLFVAGVNHVIFHGMAYSPRDAKWPGWLFYAATNFAPSNSFWRDLPALNAYIARVQSFLQAGKPANDVLVYFPIYDLWAQDVGAKNMLHYLQVHNSTVWLEQNLPATHRAARSMWDRGYGFDFISDRQIRKRLSATDGSLQADGGKYRVLVVPESKIIPLETLRSIIDLAQAGGTVVFLRGLPSDVPGLHDAEKRRDELKKLLSAVELKETSQKNIHEARVGQGRVLVGDDLQAVLDAAKVRREPMTDRGLRFIRRIDDDGWTYFITNPTKESLDGWIELGVDAKSVAIYDPRLGTQGTAALRKTRQASEVYLQLAPGESCVLRALNKKVAGSKWTYVAKDGASQPISGTWRVEFIDGGPELPKPLSLEELKSWTEQKERPELATFSGTARYTITFEKPAVKADDWLLDLGKVCESARVKLNGKPLDTLFARPFSVRLGRALQEGENRLEIEVSNLMANRVIDMSRRGIDWQKYFFVYMTKRPPQKWKPLPSGLLGPVQLTPLSTKVNPD
ncbi:MAG: glycoside hydrolase family 2, partial [Pirellulales bacterium]|nr:glycoside hydrolase family 2 [Pirellulales bacterium]